MWGGDKWKTPTIKRQNALNPHVLQLNGYRVLLTRGRDGFIVFVPNAPRYESTATVLQLAGLKELDEGASRTKRVNTQSYYWRGWDKKRYPN